MKKHIREWLWFIGLYVAGVTSVASFSALCHYLIPH